MSDDTRTAPSRLGVPDHRFGALVATAAMPLVGRAWIAFSGPDWPGASLVMIAIQVVALHNIVQAYWYSVFAMLLGVTSVGSLADYRAGWSIGGLPRPGVAAGERGGD